MYVETRMTLSSGGGSVSSSLRVLILTDKLDDAELMIEKLAESGFNADSKRVVTREQDIAHLESDLDVMLVSHPFAQFDAGQALYLVPERNPAIPFIPVVGDTEERSAGDSLRGEADGYLLGDQVVRLGPMVR